MKKRILFFSKVVILMIVLCACGDNKDAQKIVVDMSDTYNYQLQGINFSLPVDWDGGNTLFSQNENMGDEYATGCVYSKNNGAGDRLGLFYLEFLNYERLDDFRHDYGDEWNGCNAGDAKKLEVDTLDLGEYICDEVKKGVIDGASESHTIVLKSSDGNIMYNTFFNHKGRSFQLIVGGKMNEEDIQKIIAAVDVKNSKDTSEIKSIEAVYYGDNTIGTRVDNDSHISVDIEYANGMKAEDVKGWSITNSGTIQSGSNSFTVEYNGVTTIIEIEGVSDSENDSSANSYDDNQIQQRPSDRWTVVTNDETKSICWSLAQNAVESRLKYPSTAKFQFSYASKKVLIKENGKGMYEVTSTVKSENDFGKMVTQVFIVKIRKDGSNYSVESCQFPNL